MAEYSTGLSPAQVERLAVLSEEMAEAQQVIGKILRHGWQHDGHDNRIALEHELGDVKWATELLAAADDIWMATVERFAGEKPAKAQAHLHYNSAEVC